MTFEDAMRQTCKELGYDGHLKEIKYKKDVHTYAEKITCTYRKLPIFVKNSYMYLNGVDFCFSQFEDTVDFAISGNIHGNDKLNIEYAIRQALEICRVCEQKMKQD